MSLHSSSQQAATQYIRQKRSAAAENRTHHVESVT